MRIPNQRFVVFQKSSSIPVHYHYAFVLILLFHPHLMLKVKEGPSSGELFFTMKSSKPKSLGISLCFHNGYNKLIGK